MQTSKDVLRQLIAFQEFYASDFFLHKSGYLVWKKRDRLAANIF